MELNLHQKEAVESTSQRILCLAGAGTGKTQVMISRMIRLVNEGTDPKSILGLTFTNAAAGEMLNRYYKILGRITDNHPLFQTFHAFCYSLICKDTVIRNHLGYSRSPEVIDETNFKSIKQSAKMKLGIKLSDAQLAHPDTIPPKDKFAYSAYLKEIDKQMKQRNLITFDMMSTSICNLFKEDDILIQRYKKKFQYIFVDEFQDTDRLQYEFAMSFTNSNLFFVGDALQTLYSFRNADSSIIKGLATNKDWAVFKLDENYRSTIDICEFANNMSDYADESYRIPLLGRHKGEEVKVFHPEHLSLNRVADIAHSLLQKAGGTCAILCRTNGLVSELADYLEDEGIPHFTKNSKSDTEECIESIKNSEYMLNWLESSLSLEQLTKWIRDSFIMTDVEFKLEEFERRFSAVPEVHRRLSKINTIAEYVKVEKLDIEDAKTVENLCKHFIDDEDNDQKGIYIGTIHSAKGLEYDSVVLPDVNSNRFKLNCEDNYNCYYVGITRAKSNLVVFIN